MDAFYGKLYLIIDGECKSSTGHLLSLVKYHKWGTIIGEETGSSFYCNDGSVPLLLPNTKLGLNLPNKEFVTAVEGFTKGEPIKPDYEVKQTLKDLIEGKDTALNFAFDLIKK